jgi:hypothetical protein
VEFKLKFKLKIKIFSFNIFQILFNKPKKFIYIKLLNFKNMNSDTLRERQRMLQAERQRSYRERKRQIEKENTAPSKEQKKLLIKLLNYHQFQKHVFIHEFHLNYVVIH